MPREKKAYPLHEGDAKPPSYDRVVSGLTDEEIEIEIRIGRGDEGFQEALRIEAKRRGIKTEETP